MCSAAVTGVMTHHLHCSRTRFQCRRLSSIIIYALSSFSRRYHCRSGIGWGRRCCHSLTGRGFFAVFALSNKWTAAQSFSLLLSGLDCPPLSVSSCLLILLLWQGQGDSTCCVLRPFSRVVEFLSASARRSDVTSPGQVSRITIFFILFIFSVNFNHKNKMNK